MSVLVPGTIHTYFRHDPCGVLAVIHECAPHAKVSESVTCSCGDCRAPTPCNCPKQYPCDLCASGEPPEQSGLRAIAVNHAFSKDLQ